MKKEISVIIIYTIIFMGSTSVNASEHTLVKEANALALDNITYKDSDMNPPLRNIREVKAAISNNIPFKKMVCNQFVAVALIKSGLFHLPDNSSTDLTSLFNILNAMKSKNPEDLDLGDIVFMLRDSGNFNCDGEPRNQSLSGQHNHVGIVVEKTTFDNNTGVVLAESGGKVRQCLKVMPGKAKPGKATGAHKLFYPNYYLKRIMWGYARYTPKSPLNAPPIHLIIDHKN